jgi:Xaa-Pro dipeptidase
MTDVLARTKSASTYPFGEAVAGSDAAFPKAEFDRHLAAVQIGMAAKDLDLLLVTGPENIFYLCGQQSPGYYMFQCLCVPRSGRPFLVLRGLEAANARANSYVEDIIGYEDGVSGSQFLAKELRRRGWGGKRVGLDPNSWFLTVAQHQTLLGAFGALQDGSGIVDPLRAVKSPSELAQIERAAVAVDAGMRAAIAEIRVGASENDVAAAMVAAAYREGSEYVGMEPFVCSGPRSGLRHATWRRRVLQEGDIVTLENAACVNRYHSALFRSAFVGRNADSLARAMRDTCLEGLEVALSKLRPGNTCADVHNGVQAVIDKHGYTDHFRKRAGYSIGISFAPDWGEGNVLSLHSEVHTPLQPGMVFHMPISLCYHGRFTVAASETAIVTEGSARPLSAVERALF